MGSLSFSSSIYHRSHHLLLPVPVPVPVRSPTVGMRPAVARSGRRNPDFGMVDESMIVLRKRIHDMEVAERNYEAPPEWTGWEKRYYTRYGSDVCRLAGLLQALLVDARPGVGLGFLALVAISLPTSALFLWIHLLHAARALSIGLG